MTNRRLAALAAFAALVVTSVLVFRVYARQSPPSSVTEPREQFRTMFARGYYPGRSGQIMVVPRESYVITREDTAVAFMHGSPWLHDTSIPIFFAGVGITPGVYDTPAVQQDVAPTIAAALGTSMPRTATGRVLPVIASAGPRPRAVVLMVLDGMRADYFTRYASEIPSLTRLREQAAWMSNVRINYLPTNTAVGHSTISTGADPGVHGLTGNNLYDRVNRRRQDMYTGLNPGDLAAPTLSDMWQLETGGRATILVLGPSFHAATALAGHGACQLNGAPIVMASYNDREGYWYTNPKCYAPIDVLKDLQANTLFPADGMWKGFKVDTPAEVRRTSMWPGFEAEAAVRLIDSSAIGADATADLVLLNVKTADYVGHRYGPSSPQMREALGAVDRQVARVLEAIEKKVGKDYLLAVTADHGMPDVPRDGRIYATHVQEALNARFDPTEKKLIVYYEPENAQIFVDPERRDALKLTLDDLKAFLESQPYIFAAFTEDEIRRAVRALR